MDSPNNLDLIPEDSDDDDELLALLILKREAIRKRKIESYPQRNVICKQLLTNDDKFLKYFQMSRATFEDLHDLLQEKINRDFCNRKHFVSTRERLAVGLRHLVTGDSYAKLSSNFQIGTYAVGVIVERVRESICKILEPIYLPPLTLNIWKQSEIGYEENWNFPNCVGCIDAKKIYAKRLPNRRYTLSKCTYDYITLLTVIDPYYKFITVDIIEYKQQDISAILKNSILYKIYVSKNNFPPPKHLPGGKKLVPRILLADEAFPYKPYILKPFPNLKYKGQELKEEKMNFNNRLLYARQTVEKTLISLIHKWGILKRPIESKIDHAMKIVKATICLHNFVTTKQGYSHIVVPEGTEMSKGIGLMPNANRVPNNIAKAIRENFVIHFKNK